MILDGLGQKTILKNGTKRLLLPLFNALSYKLVDKTLRKNL